MFSPESLGLRAAWEALRGVLGGAWGSLRERRELAEKVAGPTASREVRKVVAEWLERQTTRTQLLSEDPAARRAAEQDLRQALDEEVEDPPDPGAMVVAAREELLGEEPASPRIVRADRGSRARDEHTHEALGQLHEKVDSLQPEPATGQLPPTVSRLLDDLAAHTPEAEQRLRSFLSQGPTQPAVRRCLDVQPIASHQLAWETLAVYAGARHWPELAADLWGKALEGNPDPGRVLAHQALAAVQAEDDERGSASAAAALEVDPGSVFVRAVDNALAGRWEELANTDLDRLDIAEFDAFVTAGFVVQALVEQGRLAEARELAERRAAVEDHPSGQAQLAHVKLVSAQQDAERTTARVHQALELAQKARDQHHVWGLPSPLAASVIAHAAFELNKWGVIRELGADLEVFPEELAVPPTAQLVALAGAREGLPVRPAEDELTESSRLLLEAVRMEASGEASKTAIRDRLQEALEAANNPQDRADALSFLAQYGAAPEGEISDLRDVQPMAAARVEALQAGARGDYEAVGDHLSPYTGEPGVASLLADLLDEGGLHDKAVQVGLDAYERSEDIQELVVAVDRAALHLAGSDESHTELLARTKELASEALAGQLDASSRADVLRALTQLHVRQDNWQEASRLQQKLYELDPTETNTWNLAITYFNAGDSERAWELLQEHPDLAPPRPEHLRLLATLVATHGEQAAAVDRLLDAAQQFRDQPDIYGSALVAALDTTSHMDAPEAGPRAYRLVEAYIEEHPDNPYVWTVGIEELVEQLSPLSQDQHAFERSISLGVLPLAVACTLAGRGVPELLVDGSQQIVQAAPQGLWARQRDKRIAAAALTGGRVVVDPTVVYVAAMLDRKVGGQPAPSAVCMGQLERVEATSDTAMAVTEARSRAPREDGRLLPPTGTDDRRRLVEIDQQERDRRRAVAEQMQEVLSRTYTVDPSSGCRLLAETELGDGTRGALSAAEYALANDLPLWCDDTALRELVHEAGGKAFSTRALLDGLHKAAVIDADTHHAWVKALHTSWVADWRFTYEEIVELADQEGWQPASAAVPLTQPGWWAAAGNVGRIAELFRQVLTEAPDAAAGWFATATRGMALHTAPTHAMTAALALQVIAVAEEDDRPRVAAEILNAWQEALAALGLESSPEVLGRALVEAKPDQVSNEVFLSVMSGVLAEVDAPIRRRVLEVLEEASAAS